MKVLIILIGAALVLPVWRDPAWADQGGISGIEALVYLWTKPPKAHIPVDQAIAEARAAWQATHPGE